MSQPIRESQAIPGHRINLNLGALYTHPFIVAVDRLPKSFFHFFPQ